MNERFKDKYVEQVKDIYDARSILGIKKYGATLERTDLSFQEWINHAQEEAMDWTLYLEKIKSLVQSDLLIEYQEFTRTTAIYPKESAMEYLGLGLTSEAGECAGVIKKVIRDNDGSWTEEKIAILAKELGDVLWYIARLCDEVDIALFDVILGNMHKLKSRQERNVLQGSGDDR